MNQSLNRSLLLFLLAVTGITGALADDAVSKKILSRWDLSGGKEELS